MGAAVRAGHPSANFDACPEVPRLEGVEVGGGSDGNFTAGAGVPTLDGLGAVGGNAHGEGEFIVPSKMPERTALLAGLIESLRTNPL